MKGETTEKELLSTGGCRKRGVLGAKSRNDILGRGNSICKGREAWDRMAHIAAVRPLVVYVSIPLPPAPSPPPHPRPVHKPNMGPLLASDSEPCPLGSIPGNLSGHASVWLQLLSLDFIFQSWTLGSMAPLPPPFWSMRSGVCLSSPWCLTSPCGLTSLAGGFCEYFLLARRGTCRHLESVWNTLLRYLDIVLQGTGGFEGGGWTEEWPQQPRWFLMSQTAAVTVLRRQGLWLPGCEDKAILFPRVKYTA